MPGRCFDSRPSAPPGKTMSDIVHWTYGCDAAWSTEGQQRNACRAWVGNRTGDWSPPWCCDRMQARNSPWLERLEGQSLWLRLRPGDVIVAAAPELVFRGHADCRDSLPRLKARGVTPEVVENRFDLASDAGRAEVHRAIAHVRASGRGG